MNCPRCGLLNLSTADICVYCKAPLEEFLGADEAKKNVVDLNEAKTHLPDLIDEVMNGGEVIITKDKKPIVKLVPVSQEKTQRQAGSAKGMITISDDFDEPLEEFNEYME